MNSRLLWQEGLQAQVRKLQERPETSDRTPRMRLEVVAWHCSWVSRSSWARQGEIIHTPYTPYPR